MLVAAIVGTVSIAGAQQNQSGKAKQTFVDTPRTQIKNIDEALKELEKARYELEKSLQNSEWQKELNDAMKELDAANLKLKIEQELKQVDAAKIQAEVQKAMKDIDMEKIKSEMQKALSEVDAEKMNKEIAEAMKELDLSKLKLEIETSLSKIDMQKLQEEMKRVQEIDMKKIEEQLKNIQPQIEKSMADARISLENAEKELTAYKTFINGLEKDGLVGKDNYTIEYKKGELFIDGKKQPDSVLRKYNTFLKEQKDFTIEKNAKNFNIKNDWLSRVWKSKEEPLIDNLVSNDIRISSWVINP